VREIGGLVLGLDTPPASDRCTVFIEQDINKLLRKGYSRKKVLGSVIRSIAKNYLNRVVGSRPVTGEKIFFQACKLPAFMNKEIIVSPYCHVMGAFGAALISRGAVNGKSTFKGFDILERNIRLKYSRCDKCVNTCKITSAYLDGVEVESWGYMCGKEKFSADQPKKKVDHFMKAGNLQAWTKEDRKRHTAKKTLSRGVIGMPRALLMHNYHPLWKTFFNELGFETVLSGRSNKKLKQEGMRIAKADFCFPIKISLAHMSALSTKKVDALFFPSMISEKSQKNGMPRIFCPYAISFASIFRELGRTDMKIISPSIDFRKNEKVNLKELHASLIEHGIGMAEIKKAFRKGTNAFNEFCFERREYGKKWLDGLRRKEKIGIVIIGRPYNLYDRVINLNLTERFGGSNVEVVPYECLIDPGESSAEINHMYWNYGELILSVAQKIKDMDNIYPVYFSNFNCGPDSFILTRFEKLMQDKPYLIIELDDHDSETGYLTRIEAFFDVVFEKTIVRKGEKINQNNFHRNWTVGKGSKKLWMPPLHVFGGRFWAAAFRAWGFDSEALDVEDVSSYEIGKQNLRGSECLPATTTIGVFLKKLMEIDADPEEHALCMFTAEGPCRFGQYAVIHRIVLDRNGYEKTEIFSPSSTNSYMGVPSSLRRYCWECVLSCDVVLKYIHKLRPFEISEGEVDRVGEEVVSGLEKVIENRGDLLSATRKGLKRLSMIPVRVEHRPLVGVVGEIYVRNNAFCNNDLVRYIERNGGQAWLAPVSEWMMYTQWFERYDVGLNGRNVFKRMSVNIKTDYIMNRAAEFEHSMEEYITDRMEPSVDDILAVGKSYLPIKFEGEAILTIGRAVKFLEQGADMIVNCGPFGCMPGNITNSIFMGLQGEFGKPIISLFYDGESDVNRVVGVYLNNIRRHQKTEIPEPLRV